MATAAEQLVIDAYREWLQEKAPAHAISVTITFRRPEVISVQAARSALSMYCRMLNLKAFGNSFKTGRNRLAIIPVQEGGKAPGEKHIHYHLQIEVPAGWSMDAWMKAASDKIHKIDAFGHSQFVVTPVRDEGWLAYILKDRDKTSFADAIDVANLWIN